MFKTKKAIKVKYSPEFDKQLKQLRQIIIKKDSKFEKQLLKAVPREIDNLRIDPPIGVFKLRRGKYQKSILKNMIYQIYGKSIYQIIGECFTRSLAMR